MNATMVSPWGSFLGVPNSVVDLSTKIVKRAYVNAFINPGFLVVTELQFFTDRSLLKKVCFYNTPCEFPKTPRCVVVTHLFTILFHGSTMCVR